MDTSALSKASAREGFRRDFARLLHRHSPIFDDVDGVPPAYVRCDWAACGFMMAPQPDDPVWDDYWWHDRFAEHQAAVLAEALPL